MLYPLTFTPIFKERVWGGRRLAELYGKALPPGVSIGESWEITDRPEGVSVIAHGPLAGKSLRWLMENHARELLGDARPAAGGRFPLLVKLLDAREKLSLQVHPPAAGSGTGVPPVRTETPGRDACATAPGEPKTEMWHFADCDPTADIFVGLKRGVTRAEFERRIGDGTVAECFHRIEVRPGDTMFLPSGRVHALGAGSVLFEIQQNSDTTYRVFDWNRVGLDGKPRELHVAQALESIDFADFEPGLIPARDGALVKHELFDVSLLSLAPGTTSTLDHGLLVLGVVRGAVEVTGGGQSVTVNAGGFCVVPVSATGTQVRARGETSLLIARPR